MDVGSNRRNLGEIHPFPTLEAFGENFGTQQAAQVVYIVRVRPINLVRGQHGIDVRNNQLYNFERDV